MVDTTGAGDCFAGALAVALADGRSMPDALEFATAAAALTHLPLLVLETPLQLVLAQPAISSQMVDNLNASIHLRALLTDLFLIDEVLKSHR